MEGCCRWTTCDVTVAKKSSGRWEEKVSWESLLQTLVVSATTNVTLYPKLWSLATSKAGILIGAEQTPTSFIEFVFLAHAPNFWVPVRFLLWSSVEGPQLLFVSISPSQENAFASFVYIMYGWPKVHVCDGKQRVEQLKIYVEFVGLKDINTYTHTHASCHHLTLFPPCYRFLFPLMHQGLSNISNI
jgi:hypothetical protein